MTSHRVLCWALSVLLGAGAGAALAAQKKEATKKEATKRAPPGRTETLACRLGTEDRHARIAVVVIRGKTDSFAYYSKWKPRTCSIYLQRKGDMFSKWADNGAITTVSLEKGAFLIEHKPGEYHFIFRDIDRERYCGMDGVINGTLTIKRGSEQCELGGDIMVEGTPLGEAHANAKEPEGPLATTAPGPAAPGPSPAVVVKPTPAPATPPAPAAATAEPAATPAGAPLAAEKPAAEAASAPPTPASTQAAADKPAEQPSSNPFSAFFRSLKPRPSEGATP